MLILGWVGQGNSISGEQLHVAVYIQISLVAVLSWLGHVESFFTNYSAISQSRVKSNQNATMLPCYHPNCWHISSDQMLSVMEKRAKRTNLQRNLLCFLTDRLYAMLSQNGSHWGINEWISICFTRTKRIPTIFSLG